MLSLNSDVCVFRTDRSLYREMLFLTLAAMGKDHVGKTAGRSGSRFRSEPARFWKFCCAILSHVCLQLHSIRSTRRRSCASAAPWAGTSSAGSGPSLPAPKPSTADAASTRRWSAERFRTGPHRTAPPATNTRFASLLPPGVGHSILFPTNLYGSQSNRRDRIGPDCGAAL